MCQRAQSLAKFLRQDIQSCLPGCANRGHNSAARRQNRFITFTRAQLLPFTPSIARKTQVRMAINQRGHAHAATRVNHFTNKRSGLARRDRSDHAVAHAHMAILNHAKIAHCGAVARAKLRIIRGAMRARIHGNHTRVDD